MNLLIALVIFHVLAVAVMAFIGSFVSDGSSTSISVREIKHLGHNATYCFGIPKLKGGM